MRTTRTRVRRPTTAVPFQRGRRTGRRRIGWPGLSDRRAPASRRSSSARTGPPAAPSAKPPSRCRIPNSRQRTRRVRRGVRARAQYPRGGLRRPGVVVVRHERVCEYPPDRRYWTCTRTARRCSYSGAGGDIGGRPGGRAVGGGGRAARGCRVRRRGPGRGPGRVRHGVTAGQRVLKANGGRGVPGPGRDRHRHDCGTRPRPGRRRRARGEPRVGA